MAHLPPVYAVVVNFNGWSDTIACLETLLRLDYPSVRVVVCDNASTDGSLERLREWARGDLPARAGDDPLLRGLGEPPVPKPVPFVELDREQAERGGDPGGHGDPLDPGHPSDPSDPGYPSDPGVPLVLVDTGANLGFAGGNNVGLRYARARGDAGYVWLINNDTLVSPSALRRLVEVAEDDERVGAVGGTVLEFSAPDVVQLTAGSTMAFWGSMGSTYGAGSARGALAVLPGPLDFVSGACLLVRQRAVEEVGLLDERFFFYGEDADWGARLRERGWSLAWAPGAEVWHKGGASSGRGNPFSDYHNVRSPLLYVHKHHRGRFPVAAAYVLYRCVAPKLVRRQWPRLRAAWRAYRETLREVWRHP